MAGRRHGIALNTSAVSRVSGFSEPTSISLFGEPIMEQAQRLVRTYMATGRDEEASELASGSWDLGNWAVFKIINRLSRQVSMQELTRF